MEEELGILNWHCYDWELQLLRDNLGWAMENFAVEDCGSSKGIL